jgi:hypothetical protein
MSANSAVTVLRISLADILAQHGRRNETHAMLAEIYGWLTEGFDTPDLEDVKPGFPLSQ